MAKVKYYDIQLSGSKMTDEIFDHLANDIMLGGVKHRYHAKKIEYDNNYPNAKEDMGYFKEFVDALFGEKVITSNRGRTIETESGTYKAELITYQGVSI